MCLKLELIAVSSSAIKSGVGLEFGKIVPGSTELAAIECLENTHRLIMGEML